MSITPTESNSEVVPDLLHGIDLKADERTQIADRVRDLLSLDAQLRDIRLVLETPQKEVANSMGVTKSAVAQLEGRNLDSAKLGTLNRYFAALGYRLDLSLVPLNPERPSTLLDGRLGWGEAAGQEVGDDTDVGLIGG